MLGTRQWNPEYYLFGIAPTHPFKEYVPGNVSVSIFGSNNLYWVVPRLWPERAYLLKKSTFWWAAILVMDAIRRYSEIKSFFSFLCTSLERWSLMYLAIIVETPLYLWEWRSWNKKLDIWYSGWRNHMSSSHAQKQAREWSESWVEENLCGDIPLVYFSNFFISNHRRYTILK